MCGCDHDVAYTQVIVLLEQIVKDASFDLGSLRGKRSRAIFEPSSFKERQLSLIKSIFESNDCISKFSLDQQLSAMPHQHSLGYNSIENLYTFSSPADLIADSYDKDSFLSLNSCFIKTTVKDKTKSTLEGISEYCDVNVSLLCQRLEKKKGGTDLKVYSIRTYCLLYWHLKMWTRWLIQYCQRWAAQTAPPN